MLLFYGERRMLGLWVHHLADVIARKYFMFKKLVSWLPVSSPTCKRTFHVDTLPWQQVKPWTAWKIKLFLNPWERREHRAKRLPPRQERQTSQHKKPQLTRAETYTQRPLWEPLPRQEDLNSVWCIAGGSTQTSPKVKNSRLSVIEEDLTIFIHSRSST